MVKTAKGAEAIQPFYVMQLLEKAKLLETAGQNLIHMEIGEPKFPLAAPVAKALIQAVEDSDLGYTSASGLPELRQAIARSYPTDSKIAPEHVLITPGSSGAIELALACIMNCGDDVLLTDPGYPCNRHIVSILGGNPVAVNIDASTAYRPTAAQIQSAWTDTTVAVMLASPANPTGTVMDEQNLQEILDVVKMLGGGVIMDEIYSGLIYGDSPPSAAGSGEHVFVVNSFSKYHGLTGLRTGWLVCPEQFVPVAEKLAQNLFLSASTIGQYGALAALSDESADIFESRKHLFEERRDFLLDVLPKLGFSIPATPQGAFYIYADCSSLTGDSFGFCEKLLQEAGVVVTPGLDFGSNQPEKFIRFSYTSELSELKTGVDRIKTFLQTADI